MAHVLDDAVDWITSQIAEISLHTADPGDNGANEYSGGSYTRLSPTYASASSGSADITANLEFDGAANDGPITHYGVWKSGSPNTFWYGVDVTDTSFNSDGRLDVDSATVSVS